MKKVEKDEESGKEEKGTFTCMIIQENKKKKLIFL